LTFVFDVGLDHPVHGVYGWGSPTPRRKKLSNKEIKIWSWAPLGARQLNLRHCTANYRPILSSERAPHINKPTTV
jgi:hypothetical protein